MTTAADRFKPQRVGPSTISRIAVVLLGGCLVLGLASPAEAQIGVGTLPNGATTGGGINAGTGSNVGTTQGLSQSGQIQSSAAIQRDQAAFIGRNGGEHPRSLASAIPTSVNSQFTPNTVATQDQRTKLVYEVRLRIDPAAASSLKPGMPVDVTFR